MQLGFVLFYVSAVLILNGIWMLGRIADREIVAINLVTDCVSEGMVIHDAFGGGADLASVRKPRCHCCLPRPICGWPITG